MESIVIILICLLLLYALICLVQKGKAGKSHSDPAHQDSVQDISEYPYKKKYLLTKTEYKFYNALKTECDMRNMLICPKVRLEDFIQVTAKEKQLKYRGHIKSRHVDFLICDGRLNITAAIELDDSSHNTAKAAQVDEFKNRLFQTVGIPLHRVAVGNEIEYTDVLRGIFGDTSVKAPQPQ